ncbi:MAG: DUF1552 domain-containing protein [Myxococcaceae bacterium]|nr:DUF1552 domain-containing protein [Myxococcaceae bacterium]
MSFSRRFFLKGMGGATLALPLLPSLLTPSEAAAATAGAPKCFAGFLTHHGGLWASNMFPAASTLTDSLTAGGHTVKRGALAASVANGVATVTPVLKASSTKLTPALLAKMNVLRGLDIPFLIAHHYGMASLGNLAATNDAHPINAFPRRSIDQVMAWSPGFYGASPPPVRSVVCWQNSNLSYNYANPQAQTGSIQSVTGSPDSLALFNKLFPSGSGSGGTTAPRAPIVDLVLESYKRLRNGTARLSKDDGQRLDEHMQRVSEIQKRLTTTTPPPTCSTITKPSSSNTPLQSPFSAYQLDTAKQVQYFQMINDVLVLAFHCGSTRVAAIAGDAYLNTFAAYSRDLWHEDVAHGVGTQAKQDIMIDAQRRFFAEVVLDLAAKLDAATDGNGTTVLDRTLITWSQEHGQLPHDAFSIPVVTLGSAGGFLKTGNYCDYRDTTKMFDAAVGKAPGLPWNQFMGTCLQAMGIPHAEWAETDHGGYGKRWAQTNSYDPFTGDQCWPQAVWNAAGDVLPFLAA